MNSVSPEIAQTLEKLGARLARARTLKSLTQQELALACGVSRRVIVQMEAGRNVALSTWLSAANRLGYLPDLLAIMDQDKPATMDQFQLIARGELDQRKRVRK